MSQPGLRRPDSSKETPVQTLSTDLSGDTLTITHVPAAPELLHADAGSELRWDDRDSDHEITVVSGTCRVLGRRLQAGSYAYIPAGMAHSGQGGAWGCPFFSVASAAAAA